MTFTYNGSTTSGAGDVTTAELAAEVATLNAAIALKQNLSTAATDAELAAAGVTLAAATAAVQASLDAAVAAGATDAEVASAVAALTASIALHVDDPTDAHDASAVSVASPLTGTVQSVLEDHETQLGSVESSSRLLVLAYDPDGLLVGVFTRDVNDAITSAPAVWPDGATGVFTATVLSTAFPGAIDAYTITHTLNAVTTTYTQSTMTRNANGAVTIRPAITVS